VVDDFEPWRNYLVAKLAENPALEIVGLASDGPEAVLKATELHPDLILMDINLPELSGIQAATKIRGLSPESKILFVSQNLDFDVALAALNAGGFGYVVKSDAESQLLTAIEAVMSGEKFVSALLASHDFAGVLGPQTSIRPRLADTVEIPARRVMRNGPFGHSHEVEFYGNDESFLIRCARFIAAALENGGLGCRCARGTETLPCHETRGARFHIARGRPARRSSFFENWGRTDCDRAQSGQGKASSRRSLWRMWIRLACRRQSGSSYRVRTGMEPTCIHVQCR
jgi:CheY-like chemotaxis protein